MVERIDFPSSLQNVLADLVGTFGGCVEENPETFGTGRMIIEECFPMRGRSWVNVIPGGVPGECHSTLVVAIGSNERQLTLRNRLLEAVEHVAVTCRGETELVVFYAIRWDATEWFLRRGTFQNLGIPCVLMMPFVEPQILR